MPRFRATVYVLTATAAAIEGDAGMVRYIVEEEATDARKFESTIRDYYINNPDNEVWFGPISRKD